MSNRTNVGAARWVARFHAADMFFVGADCVRPILTIFEVNDGRTFSHSPISMV